MIDAFFVFISSLAADFSNIIYYLVNNYGLFGIFIGALIANATLFFGVPFEAIIVIIVSTTGLNPILVGLFGGIGAGLGETTGYFIGRGGNLALEKFKEEDIKKIEDYSQKINEKGILLIAFLAFVPVPFDLVGIASGLAKFDFKKFLLGAIIGKTTRYLVIAILASIGIKALFGFF